MSKTIWYINHHAGGPGIGGAYRAYELARNWQAEGNRVAVILSSRPSANVDMHLPETQTINGVIYHSVRSVKYKSNGLVRLMAMCLFSLRLNALPKTIPNEFDNPDAIIYSTVHPFGIFAAKRLAKKYNAKLVFEIRDLWPLTLTTLMRKSKWHPFVMLCAFAEKYAAQHSDLIASVLPRADQYFLDNWISIKDFVWVPNGYSPIEKRIEGANSAAFNRGMEFIKSEKKQNRQIIVYAGALGPPNALNRLVEALQLLDVESKGVNASLLVIGDGIHREHLQTGFDRIQKLNTCFTGSLSKEETQSLLVECDVAYAGGNNLPELYQYGISFNKLPSYLDASLPVLLPMEPCGDAVSQSCAGIADACQTTQELLNAVVKLLKMSKKQKAEMGVKGRAYIIKHYDYGLIAGKYYSAIFEK